MLAGWLFAHWVQQICVLVCWVLYAQAQAPSSFNSSSLGWIVADANKTAVGVPTCSFCINALGANVHPNFTGLNVSIYRCLKFDENELWGYVNTTLRLLDRTGQILCLEASLEAARSIQYLNNFHIAACDESPQQQWFFDSESRIRNGLKTSDGKDLFMAQGLLPDAQNPFYTASYNLYLSTSEGFHDSADFMSSSFTFLPVANFKSFLSLRDPKASGPNLIQNGGFENSTLLPSNPQFYDYEIFSLCGWAILHAPELVPRASWQPADGNFSLLMSKSASINQTIPTVQGSGYLLTFSIAGYIGHDADNEPFQPCTNESTPVYVTANAQTSEEISKTFAASGDRKWTTQELHFIAVSNSTVIVFGVSYRQDNCGPLVDAVNVSVKPSSPSWFTRTRIFALCIAGLVTLLLLMGVPTLVLKGKRYYTTYALAKRYEIDKGNMYTWREIKRSTKNFTTVIGEGGFGIVYKAEFEDGTEGAVKVEKRQEKRTDQFTREVAVLQQLHHRNLVNLLGVCFEKGMHILVFQYMPNGSLYNRLHPSNNPRAEARNISILPWSSRMKICYQVACALEYLHHDITPPIVHRDVKSANILLTATDSAKLADFGLSKAAPADASAFQSIQTDIKGSLGYLDPKYVRSGVFSTKSDVYSYAVVVLEIITGQHAIINNDLLPNWAAEFLDDPATAGRMVDWRLRGEYDAIDLATLVELVRMCLQDESELRPSMQQVVSFLRERAFSAAPPLPEVAASKHADPVEIPNSRLPSTPLFSSVSSPLSGHLEGR